MCFNYVHEFDLQSLKKLLTSNIKSISKLKYTHTYMICVMISTISSSNCNLWCDSMHVKKKSNNIGIPQMFYKNQTHIIFSLLQVKKNTYTHIHT